MFFPAADTIAFTEGGTEAMRLDSAGNVGIGTSSPTGKLDVSYGDYQVAGAIRIGADLGTSGARTTNTRKFGAISSVHYDNAEANLVVFAMDSQSNSVSNLNIGGGSSAFNSPSSIIFYTSAAGITDGTERMRIDSSGNVLVGTTNTNPIVTGAVGNVFMSGSGFRIAQTSGASYIGINSASGTALQFYTYSGGLSTAGAITSSGTTTSYGTSSDYRLKENITPLTNALNKVTQLKPVSFTWTGDKRNDTGFIAHELQEVMPNAVYGEKDAVDNEGNPIYQNVDTSFLVATLTAAIQEQQAIITDLKARIETLENK
jgi:hypothetical protein